MFRAGIAPSCYQQCLTYQRAIFPETNSSFVAIIQLAYFHIVNAPSCLLYKSGGVGGSGNGVVVNKQNIWSYVVLILTHCDLATP